MVVFAALVAAPVVPMRTRLILARKGVIMLTVFILLSMLLSLQPGRSAVHVHEHESLQSHVLPALSPASHLYDPQRQRARDSGPQCSLAPVSIGIPSAEWDLRFAFPLAEGRAFNRAKLQFTVHPVPGGTVRFAGLAGTMVRFAPERWARDTADLEKALVKALRHGAFGFRGLLEEWGWIRLRVVADRLRVTVERIRAAIELDARSARPRLRYNAALETVRAIQGHSSDCGLSADQLLQEGRITRNVLAGMAAEHGNTLAYHGTIIRELEGIVRTGLQLAVGRGGYKYRLCNHFVGEPPPVNGTIPEEASARVLQHL